MGYVGTWAHVPPLLSAPLLVALLWWVALGLGYRILRWMRLDLSSLTEGERGFFSLTIGTGALQYLPYGLGVFGVLSSRAVVVGFALLTVLLSADLLRVAKSIARRLARLSPRRWSPQNVVWALLLLLLMGTLLVQALAPGPFDDGDGYHLSAPKRWLQEGGLVYLPTYTITNASMGFEMLYVIGLATGNLACMKLIHYSAGVFMLLALWLSARRLGVASAASLAISLLLITTPVCDLTYLFHVAYVDFGASWMAMACALTWLIWLKERKSAWLLCLALFAGLAGSFKTTALFILASWIPVVVWDARRHGTPWPKITRLVAAMGTIAVLPILPWMFRSWRVTGNPIFPVLSGVIPTRDWNSEIAGIFGRFLHYYSWGVASGSLMDEAHRKMIVAVTALLVLFASGLAIARFRQPEFRSLLGFAGLFVLISVAMGGLVFRYWLPGILCAVLVVTVWASQRWSSVRSGWITPAVMALAVITYWVRPSQPRPFLPDLRIATGIHTLDEEYADNSFWNMWRYVNASTPKDARILVASFYTTFGAASFGCFWVEGRTCFTSDSHMQAFIQLDEWDSFVQSLRKAGVEYVLIGEKEFQPNRHGYSFTAGRNEYPFCRKLVDQYGQKLAQFGPLQLYRLDSGVPATTSSGGFPRKDSVL
jgi:hypothetical protein